MKPITYDEFRIALEDGKVKKATIQPDQLVYEVKGEMKGYKEGETFVTNIPQNNEGLLQISTKLL